MVDLVLIDTFIYLFALIFFEQLKSSVCLTSAVKAIKQTSEIIALLLYAELIAL